MTIKQPSLKELIEQMEREVHPEDWYRAVDLHLRFHNLKKSTLNGYLKEMDEHEEFQQGVLRPSHSITWVNIQIFIWYLMWKDAVNYRSKKISPTEFLKST
ncbi:hypothetical protein [Enterococcus sp. LJL90]